MKKVHVVIDSRGKLVGVFSTFKQAQDVADNESYFCRVTTVEVNMILETN